MNKTHTLCVRCGRRSFHLQKSRCSACAFSMNSSLQETSLGLVISPAALLGSPDRIIGLQDALREQLDVKAIRRKTTGTGRMRYLRNVPRRFKSGFREEEAKEEGSESDHPVAVGEEA
ncbi:unnamed protein product [Prunus armeniaca]|uniref:Uncharacterized protein n=1 Tax=Prunus armeniaca TaxID=36596 RepID=A0A6J5X9I0_PRUAR|nr:unnamed protein product [Prunus armeniaca]